MRDVRINQNEEGKKWWTMKLLTLVYWSRAGLGIIAALICVILNIQNILTGLSLGMLIYISTDYLLRWKLASKVEKPSKLITTGIGVYFLTWIVFWTLLYTLLHPPS